MMLRPSTFPGSVRLLRLLHLVLVTFVSFYLAFDVLDLDLSDFPSEQNSREHDLATTDSPDTSDLSGGVGDSGVSTEPLLLDVSTFRIETNGLICNFGFRTAPIQLYRRLIFPRSSTSRSPPA